MADAYDPKAVETGWYEWWEDQKFFTPPSPSPPTSSPSPSPPSPTEGTSSTDKSKFVMVIPPPNVTGSLHLGHTLTIAIEDTLTRWHRMKGDVSLWVPGVDHAGIATQSVVERMILKTEGKTRHDFGRNKFIERVWCWKEQYGSKIQQQFKRVAASVDWTRDCFTMDQKLSTAVIEAFVRMFDSNLIYRDTRLVSWCPFLRTALSEIEVDTEEIDKPTKIRIPGFDYPVEVGVLWHFSYRVKDDEKNRSIEVATTRIETMLGDTAVAVNPADARYKDLVGKELIHPFLPERRMLVIADDYVDQNFGTGAVKITPAHDKNDYAMAQRHKLAAITIFTLDGKISENGGIFAGQHRFECRHKIQGELEKLGLLGEKKPNEKKMQLPKCSRSGDVIEYMLIPQWWVNCKGMASKSIEAVKSGQLKILPSFHEQTWFDWLGNIHDWCVSRQLWWGHQIPAYKVVGPTAKVDEMKKASPTPSSNLVGGLYHEGEIWVVGRTEAEAADRARRILGVRGDEEIILERDEDVLDTWFSSGLFPFSVFGWPNQTPDLDKFFPTTLLETGHDILFFWVARMVMMSLELTGRLPFSTVYLHAMVRDAHGQKMSKSKGNVIDPLEVIDGVSIDQLIKKIEDGNLPLKEVKRAVEVQKKDFPSGIPECGADALRYGLLAYTRQGRSVNLDIKRVIGYRNFCNKIWNAARFALMVFDKDFESRGIYSMLMGKMAGERDRQRITLSWSDRWLLHRLNCCSSKTNEALESFDLSAAVTATYEFWLYELCDVYLELLKPRLATSGKTVMRRKIEVSDNHEADVCSNKDVTANARGFGDGDNECEARRQGNRLAAFEVLYAALDRGLRLLHPMIPFVTEELYQRLPPSKSKADSICIAPFPTAVLAWHDDHLDDEMALLQSVVARFRSLCAALDLSPKARPRGKVKSLNKNDFSFLSSQKLEIETLAKLSEVDFVSDGEEEPRNAVGEVVKGDLFIFILPESETMDFSATIIKLKKKIQKNQSTVDDYEKKMNNPHYEERVPEDVRKQNSKAMTEIGKEVNGLRNALQNLLRISGREGEGEDLLESEGGGVGNSGGEKKDKKEKKEKKKKQSQQNGITTTDGADTAS